MCPLPKPAELMEAQPDVRRTRVVNFAYAARTRYVTRGSRADLLADRPWIDIDPNTVKPIGLALPPVGMQLLGPGIQTAPQSVVCATLPLRINDTDPNLDWHFDFAWWQVEGGINPTHPSPWTGLDCPRVEMLPDDTPLEETNVMTLAVFDLNGGPIQGDTPAWSLEAWELKMQNPTPAVIAGANLGMVDLKGKLQPIPVDAFHVLTDPSPARDVRANEGLVDTTFAGPQQVQALRNVTHLVNGALYLFSHWEINGVAQQGDVITLQPNTAGRARAMYYKLKRNLLFPGIDEHFKRPFHIPPGDPANAVLSGFESATLLAELAGRLSPELRNEALDLARKQASIAAKRLTVPPEAN